MNLRTRFGAWAAIAAMCPVFGADPTASSDVSKVTEVTNLPPIVVEASRLGKTSLEVAAPVEIVDSARIAASGAQDATDLLQRETSVFVRHLGGANPALAQISLRGYGENSFGRTLVLVDGERLNNPDMSAPNLARIPLQAIDHIEVLHGPQTVLQGDGASAGLVNVITAPPDYTRKTYMQLIGGSWNTLDASVGTRGGFADEGVSYWADGGWRHSDGYRDNAGYDIWNASGGTRKDWANGSWVKVNTFYSHADYELPGALSRTAWHQDPTQSLTPNDWARFTSYGLNLSGYGVINDENALRLVTTVSQKRSKAFYDSPAWGYSEHIDSDIYSLGVTPQYEWTGKLGDFEDKLLVGGDFRWDRLLGNDRFTGSYVSHTKPDLNRFTMGTFVQNEFFLTDELSLVLGGRLARVLSENDLAESDSRNDNLYAAEAALNWRPVEEAKIFTRWSRFYRNPFLDETPWYYNSASVYVPREILAPERGYSVDVGGDWTYEKEFALGGALFVSETEREIFYDAGRGANVNSDDTVLREGLELHTGWNREKVAGINLRYALTHALFEEGVYDGNRIPLVPMHQIRLDGRIYIWDECYVRGGYRYLAKQVSCSDFANVCDRIPAFGLFDLGIRYEPTWRWMKGFTLGFDVDNLLDREYCDYSTYGSSYYPGSGRAYMFTIRYAF